MQVMEHTLEAMADQIRCAAAEGTLLRIVGGGSKDFFGNSLQGQPLPTNGYYGITSYEPSELVVTARCGTPLAELEATLAAQGQCLAFEPPRLASGGTVGGMVAAGWSGPARAQVGAVRDFVLGAVLVNGQGQVLRFGGQVMKNVAGYDVSRLLAGSWGALGLIAEVSLKVLPLAPAEATLCFELEQAHALVQLHRWCGQPLPLNASSWCEVDGVPSLLVRLRGARAAVESACRQLGGKRLAPDQAAAHWRACRDQELSWFQAPHPQRQLWRLSLPQTAPVLVAPGAPLIEWQGAQRWYWLDAREPGGAQQLRQQAAALGGSATLWRGPAPDGTRLEPLAPALAAIHRRLKRAFDPQGILNRERIFLDG